MPWSWTQRATMAAFACVLGGQIAVAQQLTCMPNTDTAVAGVPDGAMLVLVIGPGPAELHGCVGGDCQPVSAALTAVVSDDEVVLTDDIMGLTLRIRRDGMPLAMVVETGEGAARHSFKTLCTPG
ncbi:MAG: hypothetical protein ACOYOJ_14825 [Alsobacter sp.]